MRKLRITVAENRQPIHYVLVAENWAMCIFRITVAENRQHIHYVLGAENWPMCIF